MPGYERVKLTAELTVVSPEGTNKPFVAAKRAAGETGLAREGGPETIVLAGDVSEVLEANTKTTEAALQAGAREVSIKVEAESNADKF